MKSIKNIGKKGLALLMALVLMAGVLPFTAMGADSTFTVTSQSDLSNLKDALAQMSGSDTLTVIFEADLALDEPLRISAGEVRFTAASIADVRLTLNAGGTYRHIVMESESYEAFHMENITLNGGNSGGGLLGGGNVVLEDVRIENSVTGGDGGGIEMQKGRLILTGTELKNNTAAGYGGGLALPNTDASVESIKNSSFTGNSAQVGGAVYSLTPLFLYRTAIIGNTATGGYGGVYTTEITVVGGEISDNIAEGDSGADTRRPQRRIGQQL